MECCLWWSIHKVLSFCNLHNQGLVATAFILTKKAHCRISISRSPITHEEKLRHLLRVRVEEEFRAIKRLNFKSRWWLVWGRGESPFPQYILSVAHFSLVTFARPLKKQCKTIAKALGHGHKVYKDAVYTHECLTLTTHAILLPIGESSMKTNSTHCLACAQNTSQGGK